MKDLELIADKAALFFLDQFEEDTESTKALLRRKISGNNPSQEEWQGNANAYAYAYANAYAIAYANAYANAYAYAYAYANAIAIANANAIAYANAYAYANAKKTADYIIDLLGDQLENIENINHAVLTILGIPKNELAMNKYHTCDTTHCRAGWEIFIHPQGDELEKYFGSWMSGTIIHRKSEGDFVDYFATEDQVMEELRKPK